MKNRGCNYIYTNGRLKLTNDVIETIIIVAHVIISVEIN